MKSGARVSSASLESCASTARFVKTGLSEENAGNADGTSSVITFQSPSGPRPVTALWKFVCFSPSALKSNLRSAAQAHDTQTNMENNRRNIGAKVSKAFCADKPFATTL